MQTQAPELQSGREVRRWLLDQYSTETARRTLVQMQAAYRWAQFEGRATWNPFEGLTRYLTVRRQTEDSYAAFTLSERDAIIQAFDRHRVVYAPWVRFLFLTGCRPEEAAALRWEHISGDCAELMIKEAAPNDTGFIQPTKTYQATRFPCNRKLQALLRSQRPWPLEPKQRVFTSVTGKRFDYTNFQRRQWRPMVEALVAEGEVAFYLSQYHARHTFITEMVKRSDLKDVSYLCRVSVQTLTKHYLSRAREIEVPEF
ncbi:MAG: tyrosine-type recombinase/integrase [Cyanobacteria bacterium P01_D01_bin.14]